MSTPRSLVLGAHGYLGGRLMKEAVSHTAVKLVSASRILRDSETVVYDWLSPAAGSLLEVTRGPIDTIVHLAFPDRQYFSQHRVAPNKIRTAIRVLCEAAKASGCRRIVHVSTVKVYGPDLDGYVDENHELNPSDHYAEAHAIAEDEFAKIVDSMSLGSVSIRLSNSFGLGRSKQDTRWNLIANGMVLSAVKDGAIKVGDGAECRKDFVPLGCVVRRLLSLLDSEIGYESWHPLNLGSGKSFSLREMAAHIASRATVLLERPITVNVDNPSAKSCGSYRFLGLTNTMPWVSEDPPSPMEFTAAIDQTILGITD